MGKLGSVGGFFALMVSGLVAIIVGAFMLRGNMHMWDKNKDSSSDDN